MPVPDFQSLILPTLTALSGGVDASVAEVRQRVAGAAGLTPEALHELLTSGKVTKFANRVGWALKHLQRAGWVEKVQRGIYRLAAAGEQLLVQSPPRIDIQLLRHYPAYVAWREAPSQKQDSAPTRLDDAVETPDEQQPLTQLQSEPAEITRSPRWPVLHPNTRNHDERGLDDAEREHLTQCAGLSSSFYQCLHELRLRRSPVSIQHCGTA